MKTDLPPLVLFDGVCNFCNFWIRFILRRDPKRKFRFAALQSSAGQQTLKRLGIPSGELTTMIYVEDDRHYVKSSAFLQIVRRIGGIWGLLFLFAVIPTPMRDFLYDFIARNRYRWFGRRESCMVPTPEVKDRFLD